MKFNEVVEKLQNKNEGYLVLVRCGIFFVGVGKDAVILQNIRWCIIQCVKYKRHTVFLMCQKEGKDGNIKIK